jgi:GT2 family glycosyltransferase
LKQSIKDNPFVSIVIPSYKPDNNIINCIESIKNQKFNVSYEIIVVDSSPRDISNFIKMSFPDVEVIHLEKRTLSGRARSIGASKVRGKIVFFTDTDCIVDNNCLKNLLRDHNSGYNVVGGSVVNGTPKSIVGSTEYLLEFNESNPWSKPREVRAVPSCNLSVNRQIFELVGFFPDFLKGEDTLFCENVILKGEKIYFNPEAKIIHINRKSFLKYIKNQISLGEGAVEARRRAKLHGYFLINYPFLLPLVPVYRTFAIGKRLLLSNFKLFILFLILYPLIFLGLIAHTWGFIRGPYKSGLSTEKKK